MRSGSDDAAIGSASLEEWIDLFFAADKATEREVCLQRIAAVAEPLAGDFLFAVVNEDPDVWLRAEAIGHLAERSDMRAAAAMVAMLQVPAAAAASGGPQAAGEEAAQELRCACLAAVVRLPPAARTPQLLQQIVKLVHGDGPVGEADRVAALRALCLVDPPRGLAEATACVRGLAVDAEVWPFELVDEGVRWLAHGQHAAGQAALTALAERLAACESVDGERREHVLSALTFF